MASLLPALTKNCHIYGFEACRVHFDRCTDSCSKFSNVSLYHRAIASSSGWVRLYHSHFEEGHSIYSSKNNVSENDFEEVEAIKFSDFFNKHAYQDEFNILRFNIEGAEWDLLNDLVATGLVGAFNVFGGSNEDDMAKVGALRDSLSFRDELIHDNGIDIHYFCDAKRGWQDEIGKIVEAEYRQHLLLLGEGDLSRDESKS